MTVAVTQPGLDQSYLQRSQTTNGPTRVPSVTSAVVSSTLWTVMCRTDTAGNTFARRSEKSRAARSTRSGGTVVASVTRIFVTGALFVDSSVVTSPAPSRIRLVQ